MKNGEVNLGNLGIQDLSQVKGALDSYVASLGESNTKVLSFNSTTRQMVYELRTADNMLERHTVTVNNSGEAIDRLVSSTKYMNPLQKAMSQLGQKFGELARYFTASASIYRVINAVRQSITTVKELDKALTEMWKVAGDDAPLEVLKAYQRETFNVAATVGTTAVQI